MRKNGPDRLARWLAAAALAAAVSGAAAQTYPTKPVRIVVPFGPGGVADISARAVAQKMGESMGQQVVVENKPSAGGILASETVAKAEPDGYTLLFITNGNSVSESLFKSLPYNSVRDFAPVSTVGFFDFVFVVKNDSDIKSMGDLLARMKANPGKLNIATINPGSGQHLSAELFKSMSGVDAQIITYKSTPEVLTAVISGQVQAGLDIVAPVMAQVKGGALRMIAVSSRQRSPILPDVPTVAESGVPGYESESWNGVAAPVKTPAAIIERLNKEVRAAVAAPDVKKRLQDLGIDARAGTPEQLRERLVADIAKWRAVIEKANIPRQ
ncbi:MAG TPA: tripartite tricarboxylate transporter substrate binding protein [Burkholderiales bacterium]|nr:tripartite tricarboxylate transporter substrate binding protein [Burkholderiales bacterium]